MLTFVFAGDHLIYASLLFWLWLVFPGYLVVRRWLYDSGMGLPAVLALSYLISLALLSPVSVLCYLTEAPLWVLSAACVVLPLGALTELVRRGWLPDAWHLLKGALCLELFIVVADLALAAVAGAHLGGDAQLHIGRIRFLVDHGISNQDPFVGGDTFFPLYHTNLLHALYAAGVQITGVDVFGFWYVSLVWAKLLIACGAYSIVWCTVGCRWAAAVAVLYTIGTWGPVAFAVYPNKVAPLWLLPCMIGFYVRAMAEPDQSRWPILMACCSLVMGQVHGLYALFAGLALGPALLISTVISCVRRRPKWWLHGACLGSLLVAAPFVAVAARLGVRDAPNDGPHKPSRNVDSALVDVGSSWVMLDPDSAMGRHSRIKLGLLVVGCAGAFLGKRRKERLSVLAATLTVGVLVFVPPVCTLVRPWLRHDWVIARLGIVLQHGMLVLVVGSACAFLQRRLRFRGARTALGIMVGVGSAFLAGRGEPHSWRSYIKNGLTPRRYMLAAKQLRATRDLLTQHIPSGSTVLIGRNNLALVALHDCRLVLPARGSVGVPDLAERREDVFTLIHPNKTWAQRRAILIRYGVRYFVALNERKPSLPWLRNHYKNVWSIPGKVIIIELDLGE